MRPLIGTLLAAACAALALVGCGEKTETLGDATAGFGPGVTAKAPPWKPEYAHLPQRIRQLGLPPVGKEKFHYHAALHIYNNGLLVPVVPGIGLDPVHHVSASLHTHDSSGIVHMESDVRHEFTLGDFFTIWGVRFGSRSLGSFTNDGDKQVHVFVNGKPVADPAAYVMHDKDNIVVGYGTLGSFPHKPDASAAFKTLEKQGAAACGTKKGKGTQKGCVSG
jgi:hypothetical protein